MRAAAHAPSAACVARASPRRSSLAGCAVGPDYRAPQSPLDAGFVNAAPPARRRRAPTSRPSGAASATPTLSALVERALAANGDVRIAQARLQESRATLQGARAELLPEIGVAADAGRALTPEYLQPGASRSQRTAASTTPASPPTGSSTSSAATAAPASRRRRRSTRREAGVHAAQTAVAAEVARNYLELRGLQQRLAVARDSIVNQRESLRLTRARLDVGRGTRLDVARAQSLLDSTEATLPALQAAIDRSAYRIATLDRRSRCATSRRGSATPQLLPTLPVTDLAALPLGTPEQLLRRRPDLVQAERQLAAATANIGVATADLFPRVSLTGLIGFASNRARRRSARAARSSIRSAPA